MRNSDVLTVSAAARRLAAQIFSGTGSWLRAPASYQAMTAGMLPDRLRHDFGLAYGEAERRASERMVKRVRRACLWRRDGFAMSGLTMRQANV